MSSIATDRADPEAAVGAALVQAASLTADTVLPPPEPAATFAPAAAPDRAATERLCGDAQPYPLCAERKSGHRICVRAVPADRARGIVRAGPCSLRSAQERHGRGAQAAVRTALVRHRSARPRHFQPRRGRNAARLRHRRCLGRAGVPDGRVRRRRRRFLRRLDRPHRRAARRHHHGVSAVRARHGYRRRAWATRCRTSCWRPRS